MTPDYSKHFSEKVKQMYKFFIGLVSLCLLGGIVTFPNNDTVNANRLRCISETTGTTRVESTVFSGVSNGGVSDMNENTVVLDVINDPAFSGFGQFLFPTEYRMPSRDMTLSTIDSLLPYHDHIDTATTVDILNTLRTDVNDGKTVFYDIYSEQEKLDDPSRENAGLFFFKGDPGAPFAVISAGGGFSYVGSIHESLPYALELSRRGYNGFALQYRSGGVKVACEDLAAAISFIFKNAEALEVSTDCYALWGGSAGARMAAYLGSYGPEAFGGDNLPRPGAVIMQYTGHTDYTPNDPPTYVCIGENDGIANPRIMQQRISALKSLGIDTEFHLYPDLGHGFGLGIGTSAEGWIEDAVKFWEKQLDRE